MSTFKIVSQPIMTYHNKICSACQIILNNVHYQVSFYFHECVRDLVLNKDIIIV